MSDAHVVPLSHAPANLPAGQLLSVSTNEGQAAFLDVMTGATYDASGNQVGRWNVRDDKKTLEQNQALSVYAANFHTRGLAHSILTSAKCDEMEQAREQARSVIALSMANEEQRAQMLDIGVGDVHIPSAMPNFITGYSNGAPVADVYSPPVIVSKQSDYYYQYSHKDAFERAIPNIAAAGAGVQEISPRFGNSLYKTITRAYGGFIPTEVEANQDAPLRLKQGLLDRIMNVSALEREIRVASMARTSGNWNSATTILATYQWNGGANSDPVKDINTAVENSLGDPTGMILSQRLWNSMRRNPAVRSYYTYSGSAPGMISTAQMKSLLEIPTVYVAGMKYLDSSGTVAFPWGNDAVIFKTASQIPPMDTREVASSYTFRWAGQGMTSVQDVDPALSPSRGFIVRQFFNPYRGPGGGIQIVLMCSDAERQTSAYIGNLLVNAQQ